MKDGQRNEDFADVERAVLQVRCRRAGIRNVLLTVRRRDPLPA